MNRLDASICDPNTLLAMAQVDREKDAARSGRDLKQYDQQWTPVQCEEDVLYIPSPLLPDFGGRYTD